MKGLWGDKVLIIKKLQISLIILILDQRLLGLLCIVGGKDVCSGGNPAGTAILAFFGARMGSPDAGSLNNKD